MNKLIWLLLFLFCGTASFSQIYVPPTPTVYGQNTLRDKAFLARHIPEKTDTLTNTNDTTAQIFLLKVDSSVWAYYKPRGFFRIGSGGGGGFALDSIYVYGLIDTNMTLHPGHVSIFVEPKILDSLKHKFIDTGARMRNGYALVFDSTNKKWIMGSVGGGNQTFQQVLDVQLARAIMNKDDTVDVLSNAFHFVGDGIFDALMKNGVQASGFSVVGNTLTLSHQDNTGTSIVSAFVATSNRARLITQQNANLMDLSVYKDSIELKSNSLSIFKAYESNGQIAAPQYGGFNFYDPAPASLAGFTADGHIVEFSLPSADGNGIYGGSGTLPSDVIVTMDGHQIIFNDASSTTKFNITPANGELKFTSPLGKLFQVSDDDGSIELLNESGFNIIINSSGIRTSATANSFQGSTWDWNDGGSTHYMNISSSGVQINQAYLLPGVDGTAGQVLTTDGSGSPSWQNSSSHSISNERFTGSTSTTLTLSHNYTSGTVKVWKNGARLDYNSGSGDYTQATVNTITLNVPRLSGDVFITDFNY